MADTMTCDDILRAMGIRSVDGNAPIWANMGKSGFRHPTANDLRYHLPNDIDAILALDDRGRRTRRFGSRAHRRNDR